MCKNKKFHDGDFNLKKQLHSESISVKFKSNELQALNQIIA